jgi:hypothetical protein
LKKLFQLFGQEEMNKTIKLSMAESLLQISASINYRKFFLRASNYEILVKNCLKIGSEDPFSPQAQISIICTKILIAVCSLNGSRVYIPGETNLSDQLRKRSYDCGTYAILVFVSALIAQNPQGWHEAKTTIE